MSVQEVSGLDEILLRISTPLRNREAVQALLQQDGGNFSVLKHCFSNLGYELTLRVRSEQVAEVRSAILLLGFNEGPIDQRKS